MKQSKLLLLRSLLEKAAASLDDKDASQCAEFFPRMKYNGNLITYKTRINWNGTVKMAAADLWDLENNNPDNAPNLWTNIDYKDGYRYIKANASAAEAFAKGEKGWWEDQLYESLYDANIYTPQTWPMGWKLVE